MGEPKRGKGKEAVERIEYRGDNWDSALKARVLKPFHPMDPKDMFHLSPWEPGSFKHTGFLIMGTNQEMACNQFWVLTSGLRNTTFRHYS